MQELYAELFKKRLLMITGKGGIGKTLCSFALSQAAKSLGKKVCLVECSAHDQLAPLFGSSPIGHQLRELSPGISVINLNPQDNFKDFVIKHLGFAKLFEKVFTRPLVRSFIQTLPGIAELTLLGRLYYFAELDREDRFDLVIFDGFASGHFLSLMKTPDAVLKSGMVGPIVEETQRVRNFIQDAQKTATICVAVAEELVVSETLEFAAKLARESPSQIAAVFLNRMFPKGPDSLPGACELPQPCFFEEYWRDRWQREHEACERLRLGLKDLAQHGARSLPLYTLAERGAFAEPLAGAELRDWLAGGRLV